MSVVVGNWKNFKLFAKKKTIFRFLRNFLFMDVSMDTKSFKLYLSIEDSEERWAFCCVSSNSWKHLHCICGFYHSLPFLSLVHIVDNTFQQVLATATTQGNRAGDSIREVDTRSVFMQSRKTLCGRQKGDDKDIQTQSWSGDKPEIFQSFNDGKRMRDELH